MRELHDPRAEVFLDALGAHLGGPSRRSREIVAEVRGDLEAAVARALEEGCDEEEAWRSCLAELGDPEELAAAMREPLIPREPEPVMLLRLVAAILLGGWAMMLAWSVRSWDYGSRFGIFSLILSLHLPFVLLLWPGIVWRWNALASTTTALALIVLAWFAAYAASNQTITYEMPEPVALLPAPGADSSGGTEQALVPVYEPLPTPLVEPEILFALAGLAFVLLTLSLVQQGRQRRRIILAALGLFIAVDLPFTIEEVLFVREARSAAAWVEAEEERTGLLPSEQQFADGYEALLIDDLRYSQHDGDFSFYWARSLQRSAMLGYDSDGDVWGND